MFKSKSRNKTHRALRPNLSLALALPDFDADTSDNLKENETRSDTIAD